MNDDQIMHAMVLDDTYHVERVLANGECGTTELVTIEQAGPFVRKKISNDLARRRVWSALADCSSTRLPRVQATYELPDRFVVVYDFVPGTNLDAYVSQNGPVDSTQAIQIALDLCDAIADLHAHGVIHRDISPSNVILAKDGAHLIDLGIARMRVEGATKDTTSLGTWGFASPEQYGFAQTDARSDIYSIGRVLGFALTGIRPDSDDYEQALLTSKVPDAVKEIVAKACAFEPSSRYQSADEMAQAFSVQSQPNCNQDAPAPGKAAKGLATRRSDGAFAPDAASLRFGRIGRVPLVFLAIGVVLLLLGLGFEIAQPGVKSSNARNNGNISATQRGSGEASASGRVADNGESSIRLGIVEAGWTTDADGFVHYGIGIKNQSSTASVEYPTIKIIGYSESGSVIFSDERVFGPIGPGQTNYYGDQAGNGTSPARVEFKPVKPQDYAITAPSETPAIEINDTSAVEDDSGITSFTGLLALKGAPEESDAYQLALSIILRNEAGEIVAGYSDYITCPASGGSIAFSVDAYDPPAYSSYEVHASQQ